MGECKHMNEQGAKEAAEVLQQYLVDHVNTKIREERKHSRGG